MIEIVYKKDLQTITLKPGERREFRYKPELQSMVKIRLGSSGPLEIEIAGPHVERERIQGIKEYSFSSNPDSELMVGIQNPAIGFFGKPISVTVEVELLSDKKAVELLERVKGYLEAIREMPDFYEFQKEKIKETVQEIMEVWKLLGNSARQLCKELVETAKKLESKQTEPT